MKIKIHHNKNPAIFALYIFSLKCCLHPEIHCPRRHLLKNYSHMIALHCSFFIHVRVYLSIILSNGVKKIVDRLYRYGQEYRYSG